MSTTEDTKGEKKGPIASLDDGGADEVLKLVRRTSYRPAPLHSAVVHMVCVCVSSVYRCRRSWKRSPFRKGSA